MQASDARPAAATRKAAWQTIEVAAPFRLDLAVWALRRRAHNAVDRFDGDAYRRVFCLAGELDLEALHGAGDAAAREILLSLPGIGRWSAEYVLLRGLARYHVLPGDDVGARNNLRRRFGLTPDAGYDEVAGLSERWWPCAGLVYFHLLLDALAARADLADTAEQAQ